MFYASEEERDALESTMAKNGSETVRDIADGMTLATVPEGMSVEEYYDVLQETLGQVAAQPNYRYSLLEGETETKIAKNKTEDSTESETDDPFGVTYVSEDIGVLATPNDPGVSSQWFLSKIDVFNAWDNVDGYNSGDGVLVAIIDSGIDLDHPDLAANIVGGCMLYRRKHHRAGQQRTRHACGRHRGGGGQQRNWRQRCGSRS